MIGYAPFLGQVRLVSPRRLGQEGASCPIMTQEEYNAASAADNDAWISGGKKTLAEVCAQVDGRIKQECRFPDGYAAAQDAPAGSAPPSCEIQWNQRKSGLAGRRMSAVHAVRHPWVGQAQTQAPSAAMALTDAEFGKVLSAPKAVAMFYSPNCQYSRRFMPIFQSVAAQQPDVLFATVNVEENFENAAKYQVRMLPTIVFFVSGKDVGRIDGAQDQGDFMNEMQRAFTGQAPAPDQAAARAGTLVEAVATPEASSSTTTFVLGALAGAVVLAGVGYLVFGR